MLLGLAIFMVSAAFALAEAEVTPRVVVTYFHRTLRCQSCLHIESLARYDVTEMMASDMTSGQLSWRLLNFEEEENTHFAAEFELEGPSLVVALEEGGKVVRWVRPDRVWESYDNVDAFDKYVLGTVETLMAKHEELSDCIDPGQGYRTDELTIDKN